MTITDPELRKIVEQNNPRIQRDRLNAFIDRMTPPAARIAFVMKGMAMCARLPDTFGRASFRASKVIGACVRETERALRSAKKGDLSALLALVQPPDPQHFGFLYYADSLKTGLTKIGFSRTPQRRVFGLASNGGQRLRIWHCVPGTMLNELAHHTELHDYRLFGEWFDLNPLRTDPPPPAWLATAARVTPIRALEAQRARA